MSGKRKRKAMREKRQRRAEGRANREEAERRSEAVASDRIIIADLTQQAPNNSYGPPLYYEDREFTCRDCGAVEVWTARQQQWWYEVAKGPIYSTAVRCRDCRRRRRAERGQSGGASGAPTPQ